MPYSRPCIGNRGALVISLPLIRHRTRPGRLPVPSYNQHFAASMKILFIGDSWLGSCARSLREALARRTDVELDDISEDVWFPKPRTLWLRALNRVTGSAYRKEFNAQILSRVRALQPDLVIVYKGNAVHLDLLDAIRESGTPTVNVYPDYSPHAYGETHRRAMGGYDMVISTKAYHPSLWHDLYGYDNRCFFVPQGYDPALHLVPQPPTECPFDVVMVATYRSQYGQLMSDFARALNDPQINVAIGGYGWNAVRSELPQRWHFLGPMQGRRYVSALRQGKICIAPLNRIVIINGQRQPGDVDTTRSYELAAARCFFVHHRTDYARQLYGPEEVPMFDNGAELASVVHRYIGDAQARSRMAAAAHARAVPAYSLDARADDIVRVLRRELPARC